MLLWGRVLFLNCGTQTWKRNGVPPSFLTKFKVTAGKLFYFQILTLFYTPGLGIVVIHWWFPNNTGFPFTFWHRYGNLTILEFSSKWVKVLLPYRGRRAACSRGWGQSYNSWCWLCNYSKHSIQICDCFWFIQVHLIFKTGHGHGSFAIH